MIANINLFHDGNDWCILIRPVNNIDADKDIAMKLTDKQADKLKEKGVTVIWDSKNKTEDGKFIKKEAFYVRYNNPDSNANGQRFIVLEYEDIPHHYVIADGKSHVGGGTLAKKYCTKE